MPHLHNFTCVLRYVINSFRLRSFDSHALTQLDRLYIYLTRWNNTGISEKAPVLPVSINLFAQISNSVLVKRTNL